MNEEITISQLDPTTFEIQEYKTSDVELIALSDLDTAFSSSSDYIEFYIYDENQTKIYPSSTIPLTSFNVKKGDVLLNPQSDLENLGYDIGKYSIIYDFYRKKLSSDINQTYYIKEISSDRTEIRLDSNTISNENIISSTNEFISYREDAPYFVDFYLNFGNGKTIISNNISLDTSNTEDPTILIKLYEPLPEEFDIKSQLWVVEEISETQAYQVNFPFIPIIEDDFEFIAGPNFNLNVKQESGNSSQTFSYNNLINSDVTSSINQIKNLLNSKEIKINVDYEDFSNFTHFSTALTRLENFYYKVGLIEGYNNELNVLRSNITSDTTSSLAYSSSITTLTTKIDDIIQNLDGYEYFMYFNSGSDFSYPKSNTEPPFTLYSTGSTEVLTWLGSANEENPNYGGLALSASLYDEENPDRLYNSIPEYLREDPDNVKYELFVDMVSQHYDNIWLYTKDITNKFNGDNRLEYGISKDLIADAIKDFGVKLYSNNFNSNDLYSAFLGITTSGSLFPFPDITDSLPAESGFEYVDTRISASNDVIPLDDVNKRLYKRIYHNIPYLLKTKGTIAGLRALITSYGIPDTILRINEFGGKNKNESQDWDLKQNVFNYAFDTGENSNNFITSSFNPNTDFGGSYSPNTVQLRFKTPGIPQPVNNIASNDIRYSQSLWLGSFLNNEFTSLDTAVVLEYTGSGFITGSYSGSIADPYDTWGTIKFYPDLINNPTVTCSVSAPFFNKDWWSVQFTFSGSSNDGTGSLFIANQIDGKIGFTGSDTKTGLSTSPWGDSNYAALNINSNKTINNKVYKPFSGSFQEYRMFSPQISESKFFDYTLNPYSVEGNTINSTSDELIFRADLGTQLNTGSRTSIHPKVTGSTVQITQSFASDSSFYINNAEWVSNKENIYQDQVPAGIKNRVTDKITTNNLILPEAPSGSDDNIKVLSTYQSIQQDSFTSGSYTPSINSLEVALSPQDQINDDINAQLGYFNLGDYIGDPRDISSDERSYPNLDALRDAYFEKYISGYDVVDFIRLIKFFDNSLFKMIKDFTPARTSLASGVVVKQHILERNKQRPAQASWSNETYSGSIKPQSRNFNTGSGDVGQYESTDGSSIYKFTGGTGGSFERYNGLNTSPSSSAYGLSNRFNLTQSYSESIEGSIADRNTNSGSFVGYGEVETFDQREFYDGEFSGSDINVTTQSLSPGCEPYLRIPDTAINFNPIFYHTNPLNNLQGTVSTAEFIKRDNSPEPGDAWMLSDGTDFEDSQVIYIKLSSLDSNGIFVRDYLRGSNSIEIVFPEGAAEYYIMGVSSFANHVLLSIKQNERNSNITGSSAGGTENWSLTVSGSFTTSSNNNSDEGSQGIFLKQDQTIQTQDIFFWGDEGGNGTTPEDALGFFNTGSPTIPTSTIKNSPLYYNYGSYNIKRTPNINWFLSCSISYSSSLLPVTDIISTATYHSASIISNQPQSDLYNFVLGYYIGVSGTFIPSSYFTENISTDIYYPNSSGKPYTLGNYIEPNGTSGNHNVIKTPGTASFDFYFPYLTLSGSEPAQIPDTINYASLSGSNLSSNNDFYAGLASTNYLKWGTTGNLTGTDDNDGSFLIDKDNLISTIQSAKTHSQVNLYDLQVYYSGSIEISGTTNVTASVSVSSTLNGLGSTHFNPIKASGNTISLYNTFNDKLILYGNESTDTYWRIELKSPDDFEYSFNKFDQELYVVYKHGPSQIFDAYSSPLYAANNYQIGNLSTTNQFTASVVDNMGTFPTADIQVFLKKTGSGIPPEGYIITSSQVLSNQETYEGATYIFPDSPILDILADIPTTNTESTRNNVGDMYYLEYKFDNFTVGSGPNDFNFRTSCSFLESSDTGSKIILTQTYPNPDTDYRLTGSIYIKQGSPSYPSPEDRETLGEFKLDNSATSSTFSVTTPFTDVPYFNYDDVFRMGINVEKSNPSGLTITSYTMSIFPSESRYSPLPTPTPYYGNYKTPDETGFYIPTYFGENVTPFYYATDCQPTLNNYINARQNSFIMDVDYTTESGSITPVNQEQILSGSAVKAAVQDSNYTTIAHTSLRYNGSRASSQYLNVWSPTDTGTYGQLPVLESQDAYFGYFNDISDPYPLLNNKTKVNLNYLIDQEGNALPPSLEDVISKDIYEKTFPELGQAKIAISSGSGDLQVLNTLNPIHRIGQFPVPIMYSQTSSRGYSSELPLSGSGRISMFDNPDNPNSFTDYSFTAFGTSSLGNGSGGTEISAILDPTEQITYKTYVNHEEAYTTNDGVIFFDNDDFVDTNSDTSQQHYMDLETSIPTTYIYNSDYNRKGSFWRKHKHREKLEFTLKLGLLYSEDGGSTYDNIPFNFEDIGLKVWKADGSSSDLGSVADKVKYVQLTPNRPNTTPNTYKYQGGNGINLNSFNQAEIQIDNDVVVSILKNKGFGNTTGTQTGGTISGLEWVLKANSSDNSYKKASKLKWEISGSILTTNGSGENNSILPSSYNGPVTPTTITLKGSKTHLLEGDNTGSAPFWVFGSELPTPISIGTSGSNILFMSSSNINEAYGDAFKQGSLPYTPGASEDFPGGLEPTETTIGQTYSSLKLEKGDEIRFGNNENYSYKIVNITPPSQNIMGDNVSRLKIELDKSLPYTVPASGQTVASLNKDFFLVRRYIDNVNSLYLDLPFPYGTLPTGSTSPGILYPDFPTKYLQNSASIIVNDLITKGIIQP